jgi:crotonobetainyl-CoA:carnitine CoA-transferase CaiB-like acyl-CoA transferase
MHQPQGRGAEAGNTPSCIPFSQELPKLAPGTCVLSGFRNDLWTHGRISNSRRPKAIFLNANRSIVLDLKKAEGREALLRLAETADVLIYNVRPRAMARLELSYEDVKAVNPKIIYVGLVGFGQSGAYAGKPAYDDLIQGAAALPTLAVMAGAEVPRYAPSTVADRTVGLHGVIATALLEPERGLGAARSVRARSDDAERASLQQADHVHGNQVAARLHD